MSDSTLRSENTQLLPSQCIHRATVHLLGLSFVEHDGGAYRADICKELAVILNKWVSGLLAADFPPDEVEATFSAFSKLIHAEGVVDLIVWEMIPISDIDYLIHMHWLRAAQNLVDLKLPPAKPIPTAIDALSVSLKLLDNYAAQENRRSSAANTAPAHLMFSATRLLLSLEDFAEPNRGHVRHIGERLMSHLCQMRRVQDESQLVASLLPSILSIVRGAIHVDTDSFNPPYHVHNICPTAQVLHHFLCEEPDNKLIEIAPEVLPILRDLVENVQQSIRVQALHSMLLFSSRLPVHMMQPGLTCKSLQSGLLWRDVASSTVIVPLLSSLLPSMKPVHSRSDEYVSAVSAVMETVAHHMDGREEGSDPKTGRKLSLPHIKAAIELSVVVPHMAQEMMLQRIKWITALSGFIPRVARFVSQDTLEMEELLKVLRVLDESIRWAWLRVDEIGREVFEGCVSAVMELKDHTDRCLVSSEAKTIIVRLAQCGFHNGVELMLREVQQCGAGYSSLDVAVKFCEDINKAVKQEEGVEFARAVNPGELFQRFFPELVYQGGASKESDSVEISRMVDEMLEVDNLDK